MNSTRCRGRGIQQPEGSAGNSSSRLCSSLNSSLEKLPVFVPKCDSMPTASTRTTRLTGSPEESYLGRPASRTGDFSELQNTGIQSGPAICLNNFCSQRFEDRRLQPESIYHTWSFVLSQTICPDQIFPFVDNEVFSHFVLRVLCVVIRFRAWRRRDCEPWFCLAPLLDTDSFAQPSRFVVVRVHA